MNTGKAILSFQDNQTAGKAIEHFNNYAVDD
jgi:hypothetical protein